MLGRRYGTPDHPIMVVTTTEHELFVARVPRPLVVSVRYGYDIGIMSFWRTRYFAQSPADWRERGAPA